MVIQCQSCRTVFNLDETLLEKEGTKVRCSRCRHVFTAYPTLPDLDDGKVIVPDALEGIDAPSEEKTATVSGEMEKGVEKENKVGMGSGLESDLDLIYQDVFKDVDNSGSDEKNGADHGVEGAFKKEIDRDEPQSAVRPEADSPAMDQKDKDAVEGMSEDGHEPPSPPFEKKSAKLSVGVMIPLVFILLGAGAAVFAWKADLIPPLALSLLKSSPENKKPVDAGARFLQFRSVSGVFVDSEKNGPLFVIRGIVSNKYPENRRYILIKGSLLNNNGGLVMAKNAYAGNTFSEEELKTLPLDEITKAGDNRDGMARQNLNVASGTDIPFMIVFAKLPNDLNEFTVEAVGSSIVSP